MVEGKPRSIVWLNWPFVQSDERDVYFTCFVLGKGREGAMALLEEGAAFETRRRQTEGRATSRQHDAARGAGKGEEKRERRERRRMI